MFPRQLPRIDDHGDQSWKARANCRGLGPGPFFRERGVNASDAKAICAGCTVRDDCLDYALDEGIKHGIWGGKSEKERRKMRRERQRGAA